MFSIANSNASFTRRVHGGTVLLAAVVATTAFTAGSVAHASLIAAESFLAGNPADAAAGEYELTQFRRSNTNGAGQDPTVAGFSGPWTGNVFNATGTVAQWTAEEASIASALPWVTGGRARFAGVDNFDRRVQRPLSPYTASNTYYMSVILQAALGDTDNDGFVGVGFTNDLSGGGNDAKLQIGGVDGLRGVLVGPRANLNGTTDLVVRHRDQTGVDGGGVAVYGASDDVIATNIVGAGADGQGIYHVVLKLQVNEFGSDLITAWVNAADLTSEAAASASVTPTTFSSFTMASSSDLAQLTLAGLDYSKAVSIDEPRLGTTFAAVVPIPEPTSLGLGMGMLALAMGRRRR